jgi:hypothetical protein
MPFRVIQPPTDPEQFTEEGKRLYSAAKELGIPLDPEGFLYSWVNGTRVVVEEIGGEIKGFALLAAGKRWTHNDTTATVLAMESSGDHEGLLEFLKQIATALGGTEMFVQNKAARRVGEENHYTVVGYMLG